MKLCPPFECSEWLLNTTAIASSIGDKFSTLMAISDVKIKNYGLISSLMRKEYNLTAEEYCILPIYGRRVLHSPDLRRKSISYPTYGERVFHTPDLRQKNIVHSRFTAEEYCILPIYGKRVLYTPDLLAHFRLLDV